MQLLPLPCFVGLCMWIFHTMQPLPPLCRCTFSHHATSPPALQVCVCVYFHTMQLFPLPPLCRSVYDVDISHCASLPPLCMSTFSHHATFPSPPLCRSVYQCMWIFHTMQLTSIFILLRPFFTCQMIHTKILTWLFLEVAVSQNFQKLISSLSHGHISWRFKYFSSSNE